MTIHPDQTNVEQVCAIAHFIDSGYQSFAEQVGEMSQKKRAEAAFYAGSALTLKLIEYFKSADYSERDATFLLGLLVDEVNEFMRKNKMRLEWEPHVPSEIQQ